MKTRSAMSNSQYDLSPSRLTERNIVISRQLPVYAYIAKIISIRDKLTYDIAQLYLNIILIIRYICILGLVFVNKNIIQLIKTLTYRYIFKTTLS